MAEADGILIDSIAASEDGVFFSTSRGFSTPSGIWFTDGGVAGPRTILDTLDGEWIFSATGRRALLTNRSRTAVWSIDSSGALESLAHGQLETSLQFEGRTYFTVRTWPGTELLSTDGTAVGTAVVSLPASIDSTSGLNLLVALPNRLVLEARDYLFESNLIATDGTASGTEILGRSIRPSSERFVRVGSDMYFMTMTGQLWRTDGTALGTQGLMAMERDVESLLSFGERLLFTRSSVHDSGPSTLWETNGTTAGTRKVEGVFLQPAAAPSRAIAAGRLFLRSLDPLYGAEPIVVEAVPDLE
jgi:hypothetical protein